MSRHLAGAWIVWLLTLPTVAGFAALTVTDCMATTPGDDCGIVWILPLQFTVLYVIGIAVLSIVTVLERRSRT